MLCPRDAVSVWRVARNLLPLVALFATVRVAPAATPQEDAFLRAWAAHARAPTDHKAVIAACQAVMDRAATLGEFLPAIKTLAAWHLLASGNRIDAVRIFESALITDRTAPPIARYADLMARRWLTRLDHAIVEAALKAHYAEHVAFPQTFDPLLRLPPGKAPPPTDRFGEPWIYKTEAMTRLTGMQHQRYSLHSRALGLRGTPLAALPFNVYGRRSASIVARRTATPLSVEFETMTEEGAQRGVATESGLAHGLRFLRIASDNRFALLIESEGDFWVVATPARSR